jgi:uncharacterized repeat protein (TIGR04052 family)
VRLTVLCFLTGLLAACTKPSIPVSIPFVVQFGFESLGCGEESGSAQLTDLRFYVQDVQLISSDDKAVPVTLEVDGVWQQHDLALLDFEDASGLCLNGSGVTNVVLRGSVPEADYNALSFTVGVPFERNHSDPLQASAPLGDPAMHWHWRAGYKFMRAGIRTANDGFWLHLGSTGCEGTVKNISGCKFGNRAHVRLAGFVLGRDAVVVDLAELTSSVDMDNALPTDCSSAPAEDACQAPFRALGLDFQTGETAFPQTVFRLREAR